jgi:putative transposase
MSSHVYHEIFLHLNWHTKDNQPFLRGQVEDFCHAAIKQKAESIRGVYLRAVGGTDNHVHVALAIEPFVTISDMLQELKGFSSHEVNRRLERKALEWQRGYGVVSFGRAHLDGVVEYVLNQREHHAKGKIEPRLEACDDVESAKPG